MEPLAETTLARRPSRRARLLGVAIAASLLLGLALLWRQHTRSAPARPGGPPTIGTRSTGAPRPTPPAPPSSVTRADFVGAEACASCHAKEYAIWRASTHGRAGGTPGHVALIARFDGKPLHFSDAVVTPQRDGERLSFLVEQKGKPAQRITVDAVVGGGHMAGGGTQALFTRATDGTMRFIPFDFIRQESLWFCNVQTPTREGLTPITPAVALADCADWPPRRVLGDSEEHENCQSCHGSQIEVKRLPQQGAWKTEIATLQIDCEACHGPGRAHLANPQTGYVALDAVDKDASLAVCFQCHALKSTLRRGYLAGAPLASYYSLLLPMLGPEAVHADGRTKSFAYQQGHLWSDCYVSGGMTCTSCHDPHAQTYRDVFGTPLPGRFDDRQCTGCHASKQRDPSAHTHHPPTSEGARCTSCHMPYLQQPSFGKQLRFARSDHTIPIPRPELDEALGIDNACGQCHPQLSADERRKLLRAWYGEPKPLAPAIAAIFALDQERDPIAAARLVLRGEERHAAALYVGMARFLERFVPPGQPELPQEIETRLLALARHDDLDVRGLALAALHFAAAERPEVQAVLEEHRLATGASADAVRSRWIFSLLTYAEQARVRGMTLRSIDLLEKARELDPDRPRVLTPLGIAYAEGGRLGEAERLLRRSLAVEPNQPRTIVILGEVLRDLHRPDEAKAAWRQAVTIDRQEEFATLHLAEQALIEGDGAAALRHAEAALALDPQLGRAHFVRGEALSRTAQTAAQREQAKAALREGLALDEKSPEAAHARELLKRLSSP